MIFSTKSPGSLILLALTLPLDASTKFSQSEMDTFFSLSFSEFLKCLIFTSSLLFAIPGQNHVLIFSSRFASISFGVYFFI